MSVYKTTEYLYELIQLAIDCALVKGEKLTLHGLARTAQVSPHLVYRIMRKRGYRCLIDSESYYALKYAAERYVY